MVWAQRRSVPTEPLNAALYKSMGRLKSRGVKPIAPHCTVDGVQRSGVSSTGEEIDLCRHCTHAAAATAATATTYEGKEAPKERHLHRWSSGRG